MSKTRLPLSFVLAAGLLLFAAPTTPAQVTLEANQPVYEASQLVTIDINAPEGALTFLIVDLLPGPFFVPNIGTFEVGFSPFYFVVPLGPMPAGGLTLQEFFACRTANTYGTEIYMQAVAVIEGQKVLSNGLHFAEVPGDCTDDCEGGVIEVGLQVTLEDVPQTGNLFIDAYKTNGALISYGTLDEPLDLAVDAPGVLGTILFDDDQSVAVSMLELSQDGTDLTVRFFINSQSAGHAQLGGDTAFVISFGGVMKMIEYHTSCSAPLYVGLEIGDFTVIKVIDVIN
jgi:hypothetical protein